MNIDNLNLLISHMSTLHDDQFDMRFLFRSDRHGLGPYVPDAADCGTAACIAGECAIVSGAMPGSRWSVEDAQAWLGISYSSSVEIFVPNGYEQGSKKYPIARALRMLRYLRAEYLRTGNVVVDWDAPEAAEPARQPWAPPVVIAADKALPSSLTSLLREPVP